MVLSPHFILLAPVIFSILAENLQDKENRLTVLKTNFDTLTQRASEIAVSLVFFYI